jgi:hypothetical protein
MAEKKISQLTAKGATVADTDLLVVSEAAGGGSYTTKSITGANVKALVTDANLTTTDITTNNVSTSKHGFAPKAPNDATKFLDGTGVWSTPAAGGLTQFTEAANSSAPNATVPVNSLTATGAATNIDVAIVPKGTGAFMLDIPDDTTTGGNKRGAGAVDLQNSRTSASQVASGANSFSAGTRSTASGIGAISIGNINTATASDSACIGGTLHTASGNYSAVIGGYGCTASGITSLAGGDGCTASGTGAISLGRSNSASATDSVSLGLQNTSNASGSVTLGVHSHVFGIIGRFAYASINESTRGDAQFSKFVLHERTTGNTATTLTTNSSAASTDNQVILSNQSAYRFKGSIVGKQSGSVNAAVWDIDGFIVRGANAAATTLNVSNVNLVQNTPAWGTPTLAADTTNGGLQVQVTGAAATNIQWTAVIETTEVIYA